MSSDSTDNIEADGGETELAPVVFARDSEESYHYCELLADHGIVGIVAGDGDDLDADDAIAAGEGVGMTSGVAVLVEDALLDEAGVVIADREDLGEFQFDEDDETEDDDDELDFAQGLDSDFEDDIAPEGTDTLAKDLGDLSDLGDLGGLGGLSADLGIDLGDLGDLNIDLGESTEDDDIDQAPGGEFDEL
jgi:hypothetical protein